MVGTEARLVPAMSEPEIALLRRTLREGARYLEFGAGGSTAEALAAGVTQLTSVESSSVWVERVSMHSSVAPAVAAGRARLMHVDIGPIENWGYPSDKASAIKWPAYSQAVWATLEASSLDIVLVDGRFRVACALNAVWRCRPETLLMVHDFWDRAHYHEILRFTDEVASAERMVVLRPRAVLDWPALTESLLRHTLDPR